MHTNKNQLMALTILGIILALALAVGARWANNRDIFTSGKNEVGVAGTGSVLHVVGHKTATGGEGNTDREEVHELWYDEQSGDTSHVVRDSQGQLVRKKVVHGRIIENFDAQTGSLDRVTAPSSDSPMRHAGGELLMYRSWHSQSQADPEAVATAGFNSRNVVIDGQSRVEYIGAGLARLGIGTVLVDPTTHLPLLITTVHDGVSSQVRWSYETVEEVAAIPEEAFIVEERNATLEVSYLNHEDARNFSHYPVYFLGETYDEYPIFGRVSEAYGTGRRDFFVTYANPVNGVQKRNGKVTIETRPLVEAGTGTPLIGADGSVVTIDGEVVERREDIERTRSTAIELQIGSSRIRLFGINEEDLLTAVASIRRLNTLAPTIDSNNR